MIDYRLHSTKLIKKGPRKRATQKRPPIKGSQKGVAPFSLAAVGIPPPVPQGGREPLGPPLPPQHTPFPGIHATSHPIFRFGGLVGRLQWRAMRAAGRPCVLLVAPFYFVVALLWPLYCPFVALLCPFNGPLLSPFREVVPLFGVGLLFAADLLAEGEWPSALPAATKSSHARWSSPAPQHTGLM